MYTERTILLKSLKF